MTAAAEFPRFQPVGDSAVLVEFGEVIGDAAYENVVRLDGLLAQHPVAGFVEAVPAYVSLLVAFDPLTTDHGAVTKALQSLLRRASSAPAKGARREVEVCYDGDFAPDMAEVMRLTGLDREAVIAAHLEALYLVYMYGFAPGYAYLGGTAPVLQLPRKASAVRDVAAGSVIIAGPQCIVTTLKMPTGWWVIGRSPTKILQSEAARPFLLDVGDGIMFKRISRAQFDASV